jgi:ketosteroid isomerase-like protein
MELIRAEWKDFEVKLDEVLHDGDNVLVVADLLRCRGRESGVEVEMKLYSAYWFDDNGKLRRRASFTEPRDALQVAGQSE